MPNDNVLTADARTTIMDACQSISRSADALKQCHTVDGDWGDDVDAKAFYDAELRLLERLTALLAHPVQTEPRAEVTSSITFEEWRCTYGDVFETREAAYAAFDAARTGASS